MYYYFSSEFPVAIKLNGIYYGILSDAVKHLRVDTGAPFVELCPLTDQQSGVNFLLNDEFLSCPPPAVTVTDMKGGYMIKLYSTYAKSEFAIVNQKKFNDAVITVFTENGIKLSIETPTDFYAETIKLKCENANVERFSLSGANFVAVSFISEKQTLCVYRIDGKVQKLFCRVVDEFSLNNGFSTTEVYADIAKHKCVSSWTFDGKSLVSNRLEITYSDDFNVDDLHEKLIPYAFLECFLVGADIDCYLAENVIKEKQHLKDYFGDFIGIMPPPRFRNANEVGLVFRLKDNLYKIEYFTFELENRKIFNVKKCDN